MSPLAEKRWPSRSDRASPCARERSRISVEPSVPAASTTMSAPTDIASRVAGLPSWRSKCTRQRPLDSCDDMAHFGVREHVRTVMHGIGQIGERNRILGADVAAAAAVAAARAGRLPDAGRIDRFPLKLTATGAATGSSPNAVAGRCQGLELGALGGIGIARGPDPAGGPRIALSDQPVLCDLSRPDLVAKYARVRPERHAGIDQ